MTTKAVLANIPPTNDILQATELQRLEEETSPRFVVWRVQKQIEALRRELLAQEPNAGLSRGALRDLLIERSVQDICAFLLPSLKSVVNGTGIILHTGLGRAPLAEAARENLAQILEGYCNLELELDTGKRGKRENHVEELLCFLTGAEAACVVNNNAAAVFLALNTLGFQKQAVVSRGQLIEIGGSFRIPEVMEKSGALMREVGTTNKTHLRDYEKAICQETGVICVVHPSNYRVRGFAAEARLADLVKLAHKHEIPVLQDLGGGVLVDLRDYGLPYEPVASESVNTGVDVVTFSGDKVLGGPQCGILVGKRRYIDAIKSNPLMRVLRCDKLTYAVLEPTLRLYLNPSGLAQKNRVLQMLLVPETALQARVESFVQRFSGEVLKKLKLEIEKTVVQIGSGALPLEELPSRAISLSCLTTTAESLARKFRELQPPVLGYIRDEKLYFDFRTIFPAEEAVLLQHFQTIDSTI